MPNHYEASQAKLRTGDIVFFNDKKNRWVRLFQWFTGSDYYHVGIAFWLTFNEKEKLFLVEAIPSGRRITSLSAYADEPMIVVRREAKMFPMMDSKYIADYYFEHLLDGIGFVDYSMVGFFSMLVYEKLGIKLFSYKGETCSEMVAKVLKLEKTSVSPGTLFKMLEKNEYNVILQLNQQVQ
jgi:hypothetical protein